MMNGTSPSITGLINGAYEIAFQANTTHLWVTGSYGTQDMGLGMMPTSSPSITGTFNPSSYTQGTTYEVAFQSNTGSLWVAGNDGTSNRQLGLNSRSSPSIAKTPGGFQIAFEANTGDLWYLP